MSRVPLLAANWKMHKTIRETRLFIGDFSRLLPDKIDREVVIFPPFTALQAAASAAGDRFAVGGQDLFWEPKGAYTGEISAEMLREAGCSYALIGHSERRRYFGETNESANKKVLAALEQGLKPMLCVGETLEEMEAERTRDVIGRQVREGTRNLRAADFDKLVMAYEPVWAIGTGKADTPDQSNKTIRFIRETLAEAIGHHDAERIRILYGGSVKPENIDGFMAQAEIDGALVGGASLEPESFLRIVQYRAAAAR